MASAASSPSTSRPPSALLRRLRAFSPWLVAIVFCFALWALHRELRHMSYSDILKELRTLPMHSLFGALALTALNYWALTGYDALSFIYVGHPLRYRAIAPISFIGYAFSNNIGLANIAGSSVRFHFYSARELSLIDIAKIIAFAHVTFWLGFFTTSGVFFLLEPIRIPPALPLPLHSFRILGGLMLLPVAAYFVIAATRRRPVKLGGWEFSWPSPRFGLAQLGVTALDWMLAAGVLYTLLPPSARLTYYSFVGVYMLAQIVGIMSHVPAGLGVFELVMLAFLGGSAVPESELLGRLLAFRAIYYLVPLAVALLMLAIHEAHRRLRHVRDFADALSQWMRVLLPHILSLATFIAGALLIFSGAMPSVRERITELSRFLPLGIIEISHFVGSLVGVGLLLLARGLQRRLNSAYVLSLGLIAVGTGALILKGLEWEEAAALILVFLSLLPCRSQFYRKSSLINQPFTGGWMLAIIAVIGSSAWLGSFAFKHEEFRSEMWWHFSIHGDASRFMRTTVGVVATALFLGLLRLLRASHPAPKPATDDDLAAARPIIENLPRTYAWLAMLGDKTLLFNEERTAFIMYGIEGRSWVMLGDPVGPAEEHGELAWRFRELCDQHGGWPVIYHATPELLPLCLDLGLNILKLGEEAHVPLKAFTLQGSNMKSLRTAFSRAERDGCTFEILETPANNGLLAELHAISDAWLERRHTREKGFSLGRFEPDYLNQFPLGLVRHQGRIVAFCNILRGADKQELSIDLMRYVDDGPQSLMDYLFLKLMLWGQSEGYAWFNLGMAPLGGLEAHALAPLWNKLGSILFRHGEHFYNFQGLRQFKEKYHPEWVPRFLASPGSLALPRILTNVAALISGGMRGVLGK